MEHPLQDDTIRSVVLAACRSDAAQPTGWHVEDNSDLDQRWIVVHNAHALMRPQGWKLHISAGIACAEAVLRQALPVLIAEHASFKVVASLQKLAELNDGHAGLSQIGKFITVYPHDDAQAIRLAVALDNATHGLRGPAIPSDRPLTPGSLVHYRYGGFVDHPFQTATGTIASGIATPDGDLVRDARDQPYCSPAWAVDPFCAAGIAPDLPAPGPLLGGRYLVMALLHASARGSVARAVDIATPRRCVLKRAGRDAMMQPDGRDARDRLRHEAAVLRRLASDPRIPMVFDLFTHDEDLILVLEDLPGVTLEQHIGQLRGQGCIMPDAQVAAWGRELAALLETIHTQEFVYCDLKSTNVLVTPEGQLHLIDFDLAYDLGSAVPATRCGTRGYTSPQQHAGQPPSVSDDIYSLGALLYYLATGAEPALAPRPFALLDRPLALLNPAIGRDLEQVIVRCLDPDPAERFSSMAALQSALAAIETHAEVPAPLFGHLPRIESETAARQRARDWALRLGDRLCAAARPAHDGSGLVWADADWPARVPDRGLYKGVGGVVVALAEAVAVLGQPWHRTTLAQAARWLAAAPRPGGHLVPGLYVGEAGVAAAMLRAGQVLDDASLVAAAAAQGEWIARLPYEAPDLMGGTAGRLRLHLALWDATAEEEHLHAAIAAGDALLAAGEETSGGGLCWPLPEGYAELSGKTYAGYAHGAAGIADTLLDLFEATGKERFCAAAQDAGRWIAGLATPALANGSGLAWPRGAADALAESCWYHGAAGIGQFFLHAATLGIMPQAADLAARAARTAARGARWAGPTQCHGLAGNIEFLLDMFQATGDQAYIEEAQSLMRLLEAFLIERDDTLAGSSVARQNLPPSYMLGYAGVIVCMLQLADPERLPYCFLRRRSRHTAKQHSAIVLAPTACSAPPAPASRPVGSARRPL